ncbi:hypothetical protein NUSPORA_02432 [Nucleospora cyclopteri]
MLYLKKQINKTIKTNKRDLIDVAERTFEIVFVYFLFVNTEFFVNIVDFIFSCKFVFIKNHFKYLLVILVF